MLCSRQAKNAYHIEELNVNIYSIEELAYCLFNNVYFISKDFFNSGLVEYIRSELKMLQLAERLEKSLKFGSCYAEYVMLIIKASDYYSKEEIDDLEYILEKIGNKSVDERMLLRADFFMKNRRYNSAMEIYKDIIQSKNTKITKDTLSEVWTNMAIISIHRFDYKKAIKRFEKSYVYKNDDKIAEYIVKAHILAGDKNEAAKCAQAYGVSDEKLERIRLRIMEIKSDIKSSEEFIEFGKKITYSGNTNLEDYYAGIQKCVDTWKEEYREEMAY